MHKERTAGRNALRLNANRPSRLAAASCLISLFSAVSGPVHAGTDVLVNNPALDTTTRNTQSNIALTRAGSGPLGATLVAVFTDSGSFIGGGANHLSGYARSTDGGATWTDLGTLPNSATGDASYPSLSRHDATGTIYLSTVALDVTNVHMFRSTDNGLTFAPPIDATPGIGLGEKPVIAVDNFPGPNNGNVYVAARDFGPIQGVKIWRSTDGGATFGPNGGLTLASAGIGNVNGATIAIGPDHSVNVAWFDESSNPEAIQFRRSADGGLTYNVARTAAPLGTGTAGGANGDLGLTGVRAGTTTPAGFRSNAFPQLAANPVSGDLYLVYADNGPGTDKADIFLRQSTDGGDTWSPALRVNSDTTPNDQWQPTLAVTPDGSHLGVFWYDRRLDSANNLIDYFGDIFSVDPTTGALTSGGDVRISDVSFLPEFGRDTVLNELFMGDYDFSAQADNDAFYVAWGDNRDPFGTRQDVNVRFDTLPVPEPAAFGALALAATATLPVRPRRRRR